MSFHKKETEKNELVARPGAAAAARVLDISQPIKTNGRSVSLLHSFFTQPILHLLCDCLFCEKTWKNVLRLPPLPCQRIGV